MKRRLAWGALAATLTFVGLATILFGPSTPAGAIHNRIRPIPTVTPIPNPTPTPPPLPPWIRLPALPFPTPTPRPWIQLPALPFPTPTPIPWFIQPTPR
jgi:hypothetical protein